MKCHPLWSGGPPVLMPLELDAGGDTRDGGGGNPETASTPQVQRTYIQGWRLYTLITALCLALLLSFLETTIVSTSLVSITNALGGFEQRDWVVTSYLITYTGKLSSSSSHKACVLVVNPFPLFLPGFLIIYAKFSDILGRKLLILVAVAIFAIFSIVCGSISDMTQLYVLAACCSVPIVFRAFQGVGASGIYAMVTVIQPELVPPEKWGHLLAGVAMVTVVSSVLGPILGGLINDHGSWRWVFLLNAPIAAVATAMIAFLMPTHFPNQGNPEAHVSLRAKFSRTSLARLDVLGAALLLAATVLIVFGFEEAGSRYPWASAPILSTLVIGALLLVAFIFWERIVGRPRRVQEPIFPLRLMKRRVFAGLMLRRLPFDAGVRLLPLLLSSPVATALAGQLATKLKVPPFYLTMFATSLQMLGIGLCSSVPFRGSSTTIYGYEVLMGFGFGMGLVSLLIYAPLVVDREDLAVTMGAITQVRVLGGTIGLAISATILNNHLASRLPSLLTSSEMQQVSQSLSFVSSLPDATRDAVREVFAEGYNTQMRAMLYFSAATWLCAAVLLWEKRLRTIVDVKA
ncbi:major facilitator superfamily transporter [Apiospora kogelbergensis]|uniref:major facilitator superfamily transporter n=1 Tax=Apiospora kogelbergensis TaxID=1337665 RepID=UPI00312E9E99